MCHPQCQWQCDEPPVCLAECKIVTEDPVCVCVSDPSITPNCRVQCREDQCESEACPDCETICEAGGPCEIPQCEQTIATWACRKPSNCTPPTCQLMCEQPACAYQGTDDVWKIEESKFPWYLIAFIVLYIFAVLYK